MDKACEELAWVSAWTHSQCPQSMGHPLYVISVGLKDSAYVHGLDGHGLQQLVCITTWPLRNQKCTTLINKLNTTRWV